jgi:hypothetical protein
MLYEGEGMYNVNTVDITKIYIVSVGHHFLCEDQMTSPSSVLVG